MNLLNVVPRIACALACCVGASMALAQPKTYEVKPGDTVDQVIRQTMGDSPLKSTVLRQALMAHNPQAFTKSNPRVLIAGAVLTLPTTDELLPRPSHSKAGSPAPGAPLAGYTTADINMNERKNWVRYP